MKTQDAKNQQWEETLEVAHAIKEERRRLQSTPNSAASPRPGEIYLCQQTDPFPLEWLVIEANERLRLVPVDDYPLVGSHDVELTSLHTGSAAVARCGEDAWVHLKLDPSLRTRVLNDDEMQRVHTKCQTIESSTVRPSLLEEVADGDQDYRRWIEGTVQLAAQALREPSLPKRPKASSQIFKRAQWPVLVAAAAMLVMLLGIGRMKLDLESQLQDAKTEIAALEVQDQQKTEQLTSQQEHIEQQVRIQQNLEQVSQESRGLLIQAQDALDGLRMRLSQTESELRQLRRLGTVINVRKVLFSSKQRFDRGSTRGEDVLIRSGSGEPLWFEVEVVDPEPYSTYRLRFVPTKAGKPLLIEGLNRDGATLRLSLPADTLEVGEYELRIEGTGLGEPKELAERYSLTVTP